MRLERPYGSILALDACDLPDFAVLIGRNGVGKTQLLSGIAGHNIRGAVHNSHTIEIYDFGSFRTGSSGGAGYSASLFAERTAQRFFGGTGSESPSALAHDIFHRTIERYGLAPGAHGRQEFDESVRSFISGPDFQAFGAVRTSLAASDLEHAEKAIEHYTREIADRVVEPLAPEKQGGKRRPDSYNNDPRILVSMAMKLAGKLAHEIDRKDILRAAHYPGNTIANTLSAAFTRYKAEQYSWAITESERGRET